MLLSGNILQADFPICYLISQVNLIIVLHVIGVKADLLVGKGQLEFYIT